MLYARENTKRNEYKIDSTSIYIVYSYFVYLQSDELLFHHSHRMWLRQRVTYPKILLRQSNVR